MRFQFSINDIISCILYLFLFFLLQANDDDDDDVDDNDGNRNDARQNTKNLMKQHKGISKYFS